MFKRILVPLDGSALAERALPRAGAIARASGATLELTLAHHGSGLATPEHDVNQWKAEEQYLEQIAKELRSGAALTVTFSVPQGQPAEAICARAAAIDADLIVMTSHGRTGFSRAWLGSVADGVVRHSKIPVLMLKPTRDAVATTAPAALERILIPHDGSGLADGVLASACHLARCARGRIVLLRIVQPVPLVAFDPSMTLPASVMAADEPATARLADQARDELATVTRHLVCNGVTSVESHVVIAPGVGHAILEFALANRIDAVAMATHGHGASRLVLGSVADKVLRGSKVPILLRRPVEVVAAQPLLDEQSVSTELPALAGATESRPAWEDGV